MPFIAITEAAFTKLVNEQYAVLRRAIAAHERLERIVLSERGLEALAATLSTLIGAAVLVFDARGEPLVERAFRRAVEPETVLALTAELCDRCAGARRGRSCPRWAITPNGPGAAGVGRRRRCRRWQGERIPEAWLVAIKDGGPLTDFDRLTLHQAVTIVALELLRGRVAGDTERRLAGDILAGIVAGELIGGELARRLEPFGLSDRVAALVVQRPNNGRGSSAPVEDALATALREEAAPGLVASAGPLTCALVAGVAEEELFALAERVARRLYEGLGPGLRVGVGRAVAGEQARRSFHEGRCAVEALALGVVGEQNGSGHANGTVRWPHTRTSARSNCCCRCRRTSH